MSGISSRKEGIVRCGWCGTAEVEKWFWRAESPTVRYCSSGCYRANTSVQWDKRKIRVQAIIGGSVSGLIGGGVAILFHGLPVFEAFLVLTILPASITLLWYFCEVSSAAKIKAYKERVPPRSRYKAYTIRDEPEGVVAAITCPVCNADLDPSKIYHKETYHCEFCGANIKFPEWVV